MNSHNLSPRPTPRQRGYQIPVPGNQRPHLRPRPTLDLTLRGKGFFARPKCFIPDQFDRTAAVSIAADGSGLMSDEAGLKIIAVPDIKMPVRAFQHIGPECHRRTIARTRPSTSSGRTEEGDWPKLLRTYRRKTPFVLSLSKDRVGNNLHYSHHRADLLCSSANKPECELITLIYIIAIGTIAAITAMAIRANAKLKPIDRLPVHWNYKLEPDNFGSRRLALFWIPVIFNSTLLATALVLHLIPHGPINKTSSAEGALVAMLFMATALLTMTFFYLRAIFRWVEKRKD